MSLPKWLPPMFVSPGGIPVASCFSRRLSKISRWVWPRLLSNYCLCAGIRGCDILCMPFKCEVSLSCSTLALPYANPTGLQSKMFWGLNFLVRDPGLGSLMWGLDPSLLGENLYNCDYPFACESPTWGCGLDYTMSLPLLPILLWLLLYNFSCGKSFLLVFRSFS